VTERQKGIVSTSRKGAGRGSPDAYERDYGTPPNITKRKLSTNYKTGVRSERTKERKRNFLDSESRTEDEIFKRESGNILERTTKVGEV